MNVARIRNPALDRSGYLREALAVKSYRTLFGVQFVLTTKDGGTV